MLYDFRELILKDIVTVSQGDPYYHFVRFKKAMLLLDEKEIEELLFHVDEFKERNGLMDFSLRDIEDRMMGKGAFKIRTENEIRMVSVRALYLELADIDDWLDVIIKKKAKSIRFSQPQDAFKVKA